MYVVSVNNNKINGLPGIYDNNLFNLKFCLVSYLVRAEVKLIY